MTTSRFPHVDPALVIALAEVFPDRCPRLTDSDREVWSAAGAASVVSFLLAKVQEQEANPFETGD